MRKSAISMALFIAASSVSLVHGQTITGTFVEDFEDQLAGSRWDFTGRENTIDPAITTPDASVNFLFDYSTATYQRWSGTTSALTSTDVAIGAAPSGPGFRGVTINVNDGDATARNAQAAITPKGFINTGDYKMTLDMFANNSNPLLAGSTEFSILGLNSDATTTAPPTQIAGDNANATGTVPTIVANAAANGYAFASSNEGGAAGDYRVYSRKLSNDDGPRFQKRNASWTGAPSGPVFNDDGTYSGTTTNAEENFNNYYRDEIAPDDPNGPFTGGLGKQWVTAGVEQRGRIVAYTVNGKIINHLFLPTSLGGKVSIGVFDPFSSVATDAGQSAYLFDNVKVNQYATAASDVISPTDNYAKFVTPGAATSNGAATLNFFEMDGAGTALGGTGTLTLGSPAGAVYASGGVAGTPVSHTVSKPVAINADSAIYVDTETSLSMTSVTWGTGVDFSKQGRGTLTLNNVKSRSLNINSGKVVVPNGANKIELINFGYFPTATPPALPVTTPDTARLDIGKSVWAVDYSNAALAANAPAVPTAISPLSRIATFINSGFAADPTTFVPGWNGPGIVTSAPELQGALFSDPLTILTIRAEEASVIGFTDGSIWGMTGLPIDATTVLFGITYKADTNLDQTVGFDDLLELAQNYDDMYDPTVNPPKQWYNGDSNFDGKVGFDDLLALAQVYNQSLSLGSLSLVDSFESDWALAQAMTPEPTSLSVLGLGAAALLRRRRA